MKKRLQNILKYLFFLAIGGLFLYLALRNTDFEKLAYDFAHAEYGYVIFSMVIGYLAFVSRGLRWNLLLEPLGQKAHPWHSIHAITVGYLANAAVPRAGELARCTALHSTDKIPVNRLFGTVVLERIIDGFMLLSIMTLTFLLELDTLRDFFQEAFKGQGNTGAGLWWKLVLAGAFLGFLLLLYLFRHRFQNFPFYARIRSFWAGFKEGLKSFRSLQHKWAFVGHTLFIWTMYYLMIYVVVFALPATKNIDPSSGLLLMTVGGLGMIVPTPGGIGSYHYLVMLALGVMGIPSSDGVSFATLVHGGQFVMTLLSGLIALGFVYRARRVKVPLSKTL